MAEHSPAESPFEEPLACSLPGDDLAVRLRWLGELAHRALSVDRSALGVTVAFPDDDALEAELRAVAAAESECCDFLTITVRRSGGALELEIEGPPAAQRLIDSAVLLCGPASAPAAAPTVP